ncbi:Cys-Gln thioester bond-forming surface protein [Streptomyces bacillaris]|uniref:Cys-Gln thioester bond-forming surface protein n=1 Tax=Streptomyces bacillaris TaxID=68179 RepID=UPI0036FDABBB
MVAILGDEATFGPIKIKQNGKVSYAQGGVFVLRTADNGTLKAYCVDLMVVNDPGDVYVESEWGQAPKLKDNPDAEKVNWILHHSFPHVPAAVLGGQVGTELSDRDAAAGTQAAIWKLTDKVDAEPMSPAAKEVTNYLMTQAGRMKEPPPSLALSPGTVTGESGEDLGPLTVRTVSDAVEVSLSSEAAKAGTVLTDGAGATLTDTAGRLLRPATNGDHLYVRPPATARADRATITASANVEVPIGRAFTSPGKQSLILAGTAAVHATAEAKATWTEPVPTPPPGQESGAPGTSGPTGTPGGEERPGPTSTSDSTGAPSPSRPPQQNKITSPAASETVDPRSSDGALADTSAGGVAATERATGGPLANTGAGTVLGGLAVATAALVAGVTLTIAVRAWRRRD